MSQPTCRHCVAGVQLFKGCPNLSAGTVLQGYRLLNWCSNLSAGHCTAGVQLFKLCGNLSVSTVWQGCSCLSGVETYLPALYSRAKDYLSSVATYLPGTVLRSCSCLSGNNTYLPALCCRGAAVKVVSKPTCRHCAAGVQLFKWCQNLFASIVPQGCCCLSGVATYLSTLCCRGAAV